jgi:hypothetical protein
MLELQQAWPLGKKLPLSQEEQQLKAGQYQCTSGTCALYPLEEIPLGEVVTAGKFLMNQHPIVVCLILELRIHS